MGLLSALSIYGQTATVDVDFKMIEFERADHPLPGVPVRLVLGEINDWQGANSGHRFVTDAQGEAHFSTQGLVDRRWVMVPFGMSGVSIPRRVDHITVAAELERLIPSTSGEYRHFQWLFTMYIQRYSDDTCATSDINGVYSRDAKGRFTRQGAWVSSGNGPPDLKMPELNGMLLTGPGYKASDYFLTPIGTDRKHWKVRLTLHRKPLPVMR